ncbi:putative protein C2orf72 like [Crotalus adamanteus]|uniref:AIG1-type G domain-containing protein n=2 Tax=Crotalus TaxID=8728 RepID=A0AAW1CD88_CROAD
MDSFLALKGGRRARVGGSLGTKPSSLSLVPPPPQERRGVSAQASTLLLTPRRGRRTIVTPAQDAGEARGERRRRGERLDPGGMERKEQRGGSSGGGRRTGGRGVAGESEPGPCEDGTVVQRTQVVLLAGESWGSDGGQTVLSSFAHHVLPPTAGASTRSPPGSADPCGPVALRPLPAPHALTSTPSGQLIFFLCRPSSLRERPERMREVLQGVRDQSHDSPAALVGVIVQPRPDEEKPALVQLEKLLREIFQSEGAGSMEVHTAVFAPGRPDGALELKRVKHGASVQLDKKVMRFFGAMLWFGIVAYGSYYFYNYSPA